MSHLINSRALLITIHLIFSLAGQMMDPSTKKMTVLMKVTKNDKPSQTECIEGLVESYGFISTGTVKNEVLASCPSSESTCCEFESQKLMIIQMQLDQKNIENRFRSQDKIIFDLFAELELDMRYIQRFKKRQSILKMSSCKAIATKLSFHDVTRVKESLKITREKMLEFFVRSHKGAYCAVCNPDAQRLINMDKMVMKVSNKFCRNLVINSIQTLMYMHYEFKRFLNLMIKFMANCDERGHYDVKNRFPDELILDYSPAEKIVRQCWENKNDPEWLSYCSDYCNQYDPMKFSEFFEPNLQKLLRMTYFLKKKRVEINRIEKNDVMLSSDTSVTDVPLNPRTINLEKNSDVVDEDDEESEWRAEDLDILKRPMSKIEMDVYMTKFKNRKVVSGDIGGSISLVDFKVLYANKGIDYEELGRNSVSTDNLLKSVETKLNSSKPKAKKLEVLLSDNYIYEGKKLIGQQGKSLLIIARIFIFLSLYLAI